MPSKPSPNRTCRHCGQPFYRHHTLTGFHCSRACQFAAQRSPQAIVERFWSKVNQADGLDSCWEWKSTRSHTYGVFFYSNTSSKVAVFSHRFAWELTNGPIPGGLCVCHHCDNPPCCNPSHLFLGTRGDNIRDAVAKGRNYVPEPMGEKHHKAKLTEDDIRSIRAIYASGKQTQAQLGLRYGVDRAHISTIVLRKCWKKVI